MWKDGKEGAYAVRHGTCPIGDFGIRRNAQQGGTNAEAVESNYFERVFPVLFPYGEGGVEAQRSVVVDFADHIKWLLDYHNRRFRTHETFSFVAFGILQRRQVLGSARLRMQRKNFERDARLLMTITCNTVASSSHSSSRRSCYGFRPESISTAKSDTILLPKFSPEKNRS